jgi:hypothetical protein
MWTTSSPHADCSHCVVLACAYSSDVETGLPPDRLSTDRSSSANSTQGKAIRSERNISGRGGENGVGGENSIGCSSSHFAFGSSTDLGPAAPHVRSTLSSRHRQTTRSGPVRANKRLMRRSKRHRYSITSSARASRAAGISRPRAFAVLRLIASSYLVGACTGRSAGFSPLRMRST